MKFNLPKWFNQKHHSTFFSPSANGATARLVCRAYVHR